MSTKNLVPVDFSQAIGMSSNVENPGRRTAQRILNIHSHEKPGKQVLRPGFTLRYAKPDADDDALFSRISNLEWLNFDLFFDTDADVDGEMFTMVGKGTISALLENDVPVVGDTQDLIMIWARPYVGQWEWVNRTVITKIETGTDATYKSMIKIYGNQSLGIGEDSLIGFTIFNKTKGEYAKIITAKYEGGNILRINHTLYESDWDVDDTVVIGKNWIDTTYHEELFTNAEWDDVVFHKIVKDLRIGFGGQENRPGLAVGYRNVSWLIKDIDFANLHADLTAAAIEAFALTQGVTLDTSFANNVDGYGIEVSAVAGLGGSLTAGKYFVRLTVELDNYAEQLVFETSITITAGQEIEYNPYVRLGRENLRVTRLKIYLSEVDDNTVYRKVREQVVRASEYSDQLGTINEDSKLIYIINNSEFHTDANAASVINEANSIGNWTNQGNSSTSLTSDTLLFGATAPQNGTYLLQWENTTGNLLKMKVVSPLISTAKQKFNVNVYLIKDNTAPETLLKIYSQRAYPNPFGADPPPSDIYEAELTNAWVLHEFEMYIDGYLVFDMGEARTIEIGIDALSIDMIHEVGAEMKSSMGYNPTFNIVKGWDQAKTWRGRAYYLNPYVDQRFENFILVSHFSGDGAFMYDMASFGNRRELDRFDNSRPIGMEFLPNGELFILKDKSVESIDPDTNAQTREPIFGVNCISRESIEKLGSTVMWCGSDDVYFLNFSGFRAEGILRDTIRDIYLAIVGKSNLHAVRDKYNAYRLRVYNTTTKQEFLFVGKEPIEESKNFGSGSTEIALVYRVGYSARLFFMDTSGNIYSIDAEIDYNKYLVEEDWSNYIYKEDGVTKIPFEGL